MELLTWKFYKEVLNFEEESDTKFENIKELIDKTKMIKRANEETYFTSRHALLVLSGNPDTFEDIVLANKYLMLLSGYNEQDLLDANLKLLLPKVVD